MSLLQWGDFIGHSGDLLHFKIECDALTDADWEAAAHLVLERVPEPFSEVEGVPRGGLKLARPLERYATRNGLHLPLIVDDVWTTGGSMEAHRAGRDAIGAVLFARNPVAAWVRPVFQLVAS